MNCECAFDYAYDCNVLYKDLDGNLYAFDSKELCLYGSPESWDVDQTFNKVKSAFIELHWDDGDIEHIEDECEREKAASEMFYNEYKYDRNKKCVFVWSNESM